MNERTVAPAAAVVVQRRVARLAGVELFHLDTQADGPAIVCLHGRCGRAETWNDFIQRYGRDYRVIAPDQRGHGLSGKPDSGYSDPELAEDVVALMSSLGVESAVLVGHSMGGAVAAHVAALHPSRAAAVAILDKSAAGPERPRPAGEWRECSPTRGWPLPFATREQALEHLGRVSGSELELRYFLASLVETVDGYQFMFSAEAMAKGVAQYVSWHRLLPLLRCPVLLLRSGSRAAVPDADFARMQELIPDCTARDVADPDHNVHLADQRQFYAVMDEFLAGLRMRAALTCTALDGERT